MEREHLDKKLTAISVFRSCHLGEKHLCHANMPNIRICTTISRQAHDLRLQWRRVFPRLDNVAMTDEPSSPAKPEPAAGCEPLSDAAKRALAEAEARRRAAEANAEPKAKEFQGPKGPEPTRYGDWENKGIASDF